VVDRIDLIRVMRRDVLADHSERDGIRVVDYRTLLGFRRDANVDFFH
jgi:hypothetical protein